MRNAGPEGPFGSPADLDSPDFAVPPPATAQVVRAAPPGRPPAAGRPVLRSVLCLLLTCTPSPAGGARPQIMRFDVLDVNEVDNRFSDGSDLATELSAPVQPPPVRTRRVSRRRGRMGPSAVLTPLPVCAPANLLIIIRCPWSSPRRRAVCAAGGAGPRGQRRGAARRAVPGRRQRRQPGHRARVGRPGGWLLRGAAAGCVAVLGARRTAGRLLAAGGGCR